MKISGIQKNTLLDYPGKTAAVLFTQGCNFKCPYCYNPQLNSVKAEEVFDEDEILKDLAQRKKIIEAVVITGGEPTLQKDLGKFIKKLKDLGFLVKLDTNGSNSKMIKNLIKKDILDYIAMDVKAPLSKYSIVSGRPKCNVKNIKKSIKIIMNSGVDYEFRSTILPFFHKQKDLIAMAKLIKGARKYCLQKFLPQHELVSPAFKTAKKFSDKQMKRMCSAVKKYVEQCEVR